MTGSLVVAVCYPHAVGIHQWDIEPVAVVGQDCACYSSSEDYSVDPDDAAMFPSGWEAGSFEHSALVHCNWKQKGNWIEKRTDD